MEGVTGFENHGSAASPLALIQPGVSGDCWDDCWKLDPSLPSASRCAVPPTTSPPGWTCPNTSSGFNPGATLRISTPYSPGLSSSGEDRGAEEPFQKRMSLKRHEIQPNM